MDKTHRSTGARTNNGHKVILWAGLVAGVLDITAAIVTNAFRGIKPVRILQSVATGLLGADSYSGGYKTAVLGLGLHFVIATGWAAVFYFLSTQFEFPSTYPIVSGLIYGVAVYVVMTYVVLPLSAFPHRAPTRISVLITGLIVHMLCVGLPISLMIRHFAKRKSASPSSAITKE